MSKPGPDFNKAAPAAANNGPDIPPEAAAVFLKIAAEGSNEVLEVYLDKFGAALCEARDEKGRTAMICAAEAGRHGAVELFLKRGADINSTDAWGNTSLLLAARRGYKSMVQLLLDRGAAVEAANFEGQTALIMAATHLNNTDRRHPMSQKKKETVRLLLDRGAKTETRDGKGYTAETWAQRHGYRDVANTIAAEASARALRKANDIALFTDGLPEEITVRRHFRLKPGGKLP